MTRNRGLDLLRIMSAISVVLIHCNALLYFSDCLAISSVSYTVSSVINLVTRFSVPCFVLISGRFILGEKRNSNTLYFYKKSLPKIVIPFGVIYLMWSVGIFYTRLVSGNIKEFLVAFVKNSYGNLWFMPMIIMLYLLAPIFIRIKAQFNAGQNLLIGVLLLLWSMISQGTSNYDLPYSIGVVIAYASYFYLGCVLPEYMDEMNINLTTVKIGGGGICVVFLLILVSVIRINGFTLYEFDPYKAFFSPVVAIFSIYLFVVFYRCQTNLNCAGISGLTFYVYLLHTPIYIVVNRFLLHGVDSLMDVMLLAGITIVLSFVASFIYRYICNGIIKIMRCN